MSEFKKCPNCRLINPQEALFCDCGYNFDLNRVEQESHLKSIKTMYAGFFRRLIAYLIDIVLITGIVFLLFFISTDFKDVFINYVGNTDNLKRR
ncbi:MAG TPA: hypothetical protein PK566_13130 [Pseudobacteroides sp.]|nr:hypothetical protein [Pseudobacteroides sp.]